MDNNATILYYKSVVVPEIVLINLLKETLLIQGYTTPEAETHSRDIICKGKSFFDFSSGKMLTRTRIINAVRLMLSNYEFEIEYISESAENIMDFIA